MYIILFFRHQFADANCEMQTNYMDSARNSLSNLNNTLQKLDDIFKNSECKVSLEK